jgi:hypothetical protein
MEIGERDDDMIVRLAVAQLSEAVSQPEEVVEATVRDELERWRSRSRIQTFVPIFVERSARRRLAS